MDFTNQLVRMMAACADKGGMDVEITPSKEEIVKAVRFMLEESLFFHPDVVKEWHEEMLKSYADGGLYVRFSQKIKDVQKGEDGVFFYERDGKRYNVDKDGNAKVRDIIRKKTGQIVSQGANSTIKFVKISHIWGEATNPFYFTSLWNIVLIPAYCNDLMDKLKGRIPAIVQGVFRAVCREIYQVREKLSDFGLQENVENATKVAFLDDDKACVRVEIPDVGVIDKVRLNYLGVPSLNEQEPEVIYAQELVDPESYSEKEIAAYSLLEGLKKDSQASYISNIRKILSLLDKVKAKGFLPDLELKPKTVSNYKAALRKVLAYLEDLGRN